MPETNVVTNAIKGSYNGTRGTITTEIYATQNMEGGGKVSVGTTAVEATFAGETKVIIITADKDNTGTLYVGKSNVTSTGGNAITFLEVGDAISLNYDDSTNPLYVVGSASSQAFWKGALL